MSYNNAGQLATVTGPFGHELSFTYNTSGQLSTMTAPGSLLFTYGYGANNTLTSVTYPDNTERKYVYENTSFPTALTGIIDENGNRFATWAYNSQFQATSSEHANGADLTTVAYNSANPSSTITDANNNSRTLALTQLYNVVKPTGVTGVPDQNAGGQSFTYDNNGFVASVTDFNNNTTTYTHDTRGDQLTRVLASGTSLAETISTTWMSTFHLPTQIVEPNRTTNFTHDALGDTLTRAVTAGTATHTWTWTYNTNGQVLTAKDPNNNVTTYTYDGEGDVASIKNALNQTINITSYDPTGRPLSITDVNGVVTTLTYDKRERLLTSTLHTSAGNLTTSYTYDDAGNLTKVTQPDNSYLSYAYDAAHRLTKITDALGNSIVYTLDAASNVTEVQVFDPSNTLRRTRSYVYDSVERLSQEIGSQSQTTTYTYDAQSNLTGVKDPLNNTTTYGFDALNRLISALDPNNGTTSYGYNANNLLTSVIDANNHTTTYTRDGFGQVTGIASPDSGSTTLQYDAAGNLTQKVFAGSLTMNATYDTLNRNLTVKYPNDSTLNVSKTYDQTGHGFGIGRLTSATDQAGSDSLIYDERGNVTSESRVITSVGTLTTATTYDAVSRVSGTTYPSGTVVANTRNSMGLVTAITAKPPGASSASNVATGITYEPFGPVTGLTFGNGITGTYAYDEDYRPTTRADKNGSTSITNLAYGYDAADNVKTITDAVSAANSQSMNYDVLNRVTSATSGTGGYGTYGWTWDAVSNVKTQVVNGTTTTYSLASGSNKLSQWVTGSTTEVVASTAAGNINTLKIGSTTEETLTYNQANQLASETTSTAATYKYGLTGERLEKTVSGSNPVIYQYGQSARELLSENDLHSGQRADYIYLNGSPVGEVDPVAGKLYFTHTDRLGTPQKLTDSTKTVDWTATYNPFGNTVSFGGTLTNQSIRLPGQYFDPETGMYHNGFRDYAGSMTRYVESDPIGLAGGTNTFQYVNGNAFKFSDPLGTTTSPASQQAQGTSACVRQYLQQHYPDTASLIAEFSVYSYLPGSGNIKSGGPIEQWKEAGLGKTAGYYGFKLAEGVAPEALLTLTAQAVPPLALGLAIGSTYANYMAIQACTCTPK